MTTLSLRAVVEPTQEQGELAALAARARGGEREAYGELVERLWPELVALARAVLAGDDEAEDLVQESLVHAWRRLSSLRRPASVGAWMRRIVARRCLDHVRRLRHGAELPELAGAAPVGTDRLEVRRLLAALPARQRAALYLTWIEGCTDREAGQILRLRPATVRVHRFRALKRLRELARSPVPAARPRSGGGRR